MAFRRVALSTRIFEGRSSVVTWLQGRPVLVARVDGALYAMDAVCAHMGCALLTEVDGPIATCPAHRAKYDVRTGGVLEPAFVRPEQPCSEESLSVPLRTYRVREEEGFLAIDIP